PPCWFLWRYQPLGQSLECRLHCREFRRFCRLGLERHHTTCYHPSNQPPYPSLPHSLQQSKPHPNTHPSNTPTLLLDRLVPPHLGLFVKTKLKLRFRRIGWRWNRGAKVCFRVDERCSRSSEFTRCSFIDVVDHCLFIPPLLSCEHSSCPAFD